MNSADISISMPSPRYDGIKIKAIKDKYCNEIKELTLNPSHYKTVSIINRIVKKHGIGQAVKIELLTGLSNAVKNRYGLVYITNDNVSQLYDNLMTIYLKVRTKIKSNDDLIKLVSSISYVVLYINQVEGTNINSNDILVIQKAATSNCPKKELQRCLTEYSLTDRGRILANNIIDKSQAEDVEQTDLMKGEHDRKLFLGLNKCSIVLMIIAFFSLSASFITLWALFEFDVLSTKDNKDNLSQ